MFVDLGDVTVNITKLYALHMRSLGPTHHEIVAVFEGGDELVVSTFVDANEAVEAYKDMVDILQTHTSCCCH